MFLTSSHLTGINLRMSDIFFVFAALKTFYVNSDDTSILMVWLWLINKDYIVYTSEEFRCLYVVGH